MHRSQGHYLNTPINPPTVASTDKSPYYISPVIYLTDLNHVLRRRIIENVRSADAVVTGKVVRTLSSEI